VRPAVELLPKPKGSPVVDSPQQLLHLVVLAEHMDWRAEQKQPSHSRKGCPRVEAAAVVEVVVDHIRTRMVVVATGPQKDSVLLADTHHHTVLRHPLLQTDLQAAPGELGPVVVGFVAYTNRLVTGVEHQKDSRTLPYFMLIPSNRCVESWNPKRSLPTSTFATMIQTLCPLAAGCDLRQASTDRNRKIDEPRVPSRLRTTT
jgi:hypothetical protein